MLPSTALVADWSPNYAATGDFEVNIAGATGWNAFPTVIHMAEQAKTIGSIYMSLENFEKSQIDSLVTGIAAEYEAGGNTIDRIEVKCDFEEDDLLWLIAINSVLHQQDLDSMSAADIRQFCTSRLTFTPTLLGGTGNTLKVEVKKIDPEQLMNQLGFDAEAKTWAGALYEVLSESDALEKYKDHFDVPPPSYEGDTSGGGHITPGGPGGPPSPQLEKRLCSALEAIIANRKEELMLLETAYRMCRGRLLETVEGKTDEH